MSLFHRDGRDKPSHDNAVRAIRRQRTDARIVLAVERHGPITGVTRWSESGSARLRVPRSRDDACEAVLINTGGGIAGGDRFTNSFELGSGTRLVVTTAAAEKAYRSHGDDASVSTAISAAEAARIEWLPQETILFEGARLERRLDVDLASDASVLLFEAIVFGRKASGEEVRSGAFRDRWRVRRGGRLVFAESLRFEGDIAARLSRPAIANGSRAFATCLYVAPEAEQRLDDARSALEGAGSECGACAWDGMLVARWLARDVATLRADASRYMTALRGRPLPRVWQT